MHAARQILTLRCMTTPPQTSQSLKGVGLWARAHPKNGGQGPTHRGRPRVAGCKPRKSPVYSKRTAYTTSVVSDAGPRRGAGLGATPHRCPGRRPGLLWRTLTARASLVETELPRTRAGELRRALALADSSPLIRKWGSGELQLAPSVGRLAAAHHQLPRCMRLIALVGARCVLCS